MSCPRVYDHKNKYNWENKLTTDRCALATKQNDNDYVHDYNTFNFFNGGDCQTFKCAIDASYNNPNLLAQDGYGLGPCVIDEDSQLKLDPTNLTHGKERQPLFSRVFYAVPNYSKGGLIPNTETYLKNATDTSMIRQCNRITEKDFDRFIPLPSCGEQQMKVPYTLTLGQDSRKLMRQVMEQNKCNQ